MLHPNLLLAYQNETFSGMRDSLNVAHKYTYTYHVLPVKGHGGTRGLLAGSWVPIQKRLIYPVALFRVI